MLHSKYEFAGSTYPSFPPSLATSTCGADGSGPCENPALPETAGPPAWRPACDRVGIRVLVVADMRNSWFLPESLTGLVRARKPT